MPESPNIGYGVDPSDPQADVRSRRPSVFLSYASADHLVADDIVGKLRRDGIDVWTAADIKPGESIQTEIADRIRGADSTVVLVSPRGNKSSAVSSELSMAVAQTVRDNNKSVIPVVISGSVSELPPILRPYSAIDLSVGDDFDHKLSQIAEAVKHPSLHGRDLDAERELLGAQAMVLAEEEAELRHELSAYNQRSRNYATTALLASWTAGVIAAIVLVIATDNATTSAAVLTLINFVTLLAGLVGSRTLGVRK